MLKSHLLLSCSQQLLLVRACSTLLGLPQRVAGEGAGPFLYVPGFVEGGPSAQSFLHSHTHNSSVVPFTMRGVLLKSVCYAEAHILASSFLTLTILMEHIMMDG